jgi:DNA-directed RNA polymerase, sigma subunit (sigma70/sigma32)
LVGARVTPDENELADEWSAEADFDSEEEGDELAGDDESRARRRAKKGDGFTEDSVRLYLREIGRVRMIKPDEEIELARRIAKGDKDAKKKLIQANLRLVISIAKNMSIEDCPFRT